MKKKTKAELRVEIALDVLIQIGAKKIIPKCGVYFNPNTTGYYAGDQLKDVLPKIKDCEACAIGSIFYSYIMKHNNYEIDIDGINAINPDAERESMYMFSLKQLSLIETAFEGMRFSSSADYTRDTIYRAREFRNKNMIYQGSEEALIHIMNNIIKNKGTFKP